MRRRRRPDGRCRGRPRDSGRTAASAASSRLPSARRPWGPVQQVASAGIPRILSVKSPVRTFRAGPGERRAARSMGQVAANAPADVPTRGRRGHQTAVLLAAALTVPGLVVRISGAGLPDVVAPVVYGLAIVGSAFLLAWAA